MSSTVVRPRSAASGRVKTTNKRTQRKKAARREAYGELVRIAAEQGVQSWGPNVSTEQALQMCLDRSMAHLRYAMEKVDEIQTDIVLVKYDINNVAYDKLNKWYALERECRAEVERVAGLMAKLGLAERAVEVEEAKAVLWASQVREALRDAGLSQSQIADVGDALRARLEAVQA